MNNNENASFMKRFTGHKEDWGKFVDIKKCDKKINLKKISGKNVFLSSVTDCYNKYEEKYLITRSILEQLVYSDCNLSISTKSKLILRDIDLLKKIKNVTISMSINTLNEKLKNDMDNASSIKDRLETLKKLHENGIYTVLFMSPIFPYITEWKEIIEIIYVTKNNNYWTKLADEINNYCEKNKIKYVNYFYHKELVEKK